MAAYGFDLRPQRPDLRTLNRPYEPVAVEAGSCLLSSPLSSQDDNDGAFDSCPSLNPDGTKSPLTVYTNSMANTSDDIVSPDKISPASSKTDRSVKGKNGTSRPEESSALPHNHPLNRAARDLWREGTRSVRRPDGTVEDGDVVRWMMTRKGGANASWPQLEEGKRAIEEMRKDTFDLGEIWRRYEEEQETARLREERRLANKRRYRPRSEWDKEKAAKKAVVKRTLEETEPTEINVDQAAAKRARLDDSDVIPTMPNGNFPQQVSPKSDSKSTRGIAGIQ